MVEADREHRPIMTLQAVQLLAWQPLPGNPWLPIHDDAVP